MPGTEPGKFNWYDFAMTLWLALLPGLIVALEQLQQWLTGVDLGWWGTLVFTGLAALLIGLKKLATDTRKK